MLTRCHNRGLVNELIEIQTLQQPYFRGMPVGKIKAPGLGICLFSPYVNKAVHNSALRIFANIITKIVV